MFEPRQVICYYKTVSEQINLGSYLMSKHH